MPWTVFFLPQVLKLQDEVSTDSIQLLSYSVLMRLLITSIYFVITCPEFSQVSNEHND